MMVSSKRFLPLITALAAAAAACSHAASAQSPPPASRPAPTAAKVAAKPKPVPITGANVSKVERLWRAAGGSWGHAVAASHALGRAVISASSEAQVFELATGKPIGKVTEGCGRVLRHGMGFGGGNLVLACENRLDVIDGTTLAKVKTIRIEPSKVWAVSVAWPRVALAHEDSVIRIYSLDGAPERQLPIPGPPVEVTSLSLSRDGERIAVGWTQGSVWWWDVQKPNEPHKVAKGNSHVSAVTWNRDATLLAEESPSFTVAAWRVGPPQVSLATFKVGSWTNGTAFLADSSWLFYGGSDGLSVGEIGGSGVKQVASRDDSVEDLAMDEDGMFLLATDRSGNLDAYGVLQ
jgi:hypothetical protein